MPTSLQKPAPISLAEQRSAERTTAATDYATLLASAEEPDLYRLRSTCSILGLSVDDFETAKGILKEAAALRAEVPAAEELEQAHAAVKDAMQQKVDAKKALDVAGERENKARTHWSRLSGLTAKADEASQLLRANVRILDPLAPPPPKPNLEPRGLTQHFAPPAPAPQPAMVSESPFQQIPKMTDSRMSPAL